MREKPYIMAMKNKIVVVVALCVIAAAAVAVHYLVDNVIKTAAGLWW